MKGDHYVRLHQDDRAIADYDEALRLNPKDHDALNGRANAYTDKNDYDHAIADYDRAIVLNPRVPMIYLNRGVAYAAKESRTAPSPISGRCWLSRPTMSLR